MSRERHDEERPEEPDVALPVEPQASVGFQPVTPRAADTPPDAEREAE